MKQGVSDRCEDCDRIGAVCCDGCCTAYKQGFADGVEAVRQNMPKPLLDDKLLGVIETIAQDLYGQDRRPPTWDELTEERKAWWREEARRAWKAKQEGAGA